MNIAIIIAAGSGHRMGQDIPKQFINVYDRPVLVYTLENFQKHPEIDEIVVVCLEGRCKEEDIIVIHDGIRPMIDDTVLSDVIVTCRKYGNAVSSLPYNEQIFRTEDGETSREYIPRETLRRVSTPQAYYFGRLDRAYHEAFEKEIGIHGSAYTNTMMVDLGERLHFAAGSDKNIKLTTKDDLEIFKAYMKLEKDTWLK